MEKTIVEVFANRVAHFGGRLAVENKRNGRWQGVSRRQYWSAARAVGQGAINWASVWGTGRRF
ncbi:MAG: hypothetical protein QNJ01_11875 [Desulfobacterales bacterium]|nr:hypothetical protein [Desulfobacterales bacterium]